MILHVLLEGKRIFIEAEVGYRDTCLERLHVDDLAILHATERLVSEPNVVSLGERIVIPRRGDVHRLHSVLHAIGEVNVLVEVDIRPEVDELHGGIPRANTVDASEALNDADGIPVDVIVYHAVAIL